MRTYSDRTIGLLVELADRPTASRIRTLLMQAELTQFEPPKLKGVTSQPPKADVLTNYLITANKAADRRSGDAHESLLEFTCLLLEELRPSLSYKEELVARLHRALLADGYELRLPATPVDTITLLPTEPSAAPFLPRSQRWRPNSTDAGTGSRSTTTSRRSAHWSTTSTRPRTVPCAHSSKTSSCGLPPTTTTSHPPSTPSPASRPMVKAAAHSRTSSTRRRPSPRVTAA